jgi:hypothetical protein
LWFLRRKCGVLTSYLISLLRRGGEGRRERKKPEKPYYIYTYIV